MSKQPTRRSFLAAMLGGMLAWIAPAKGAAHAAPSARPHSTEVDSSADAMSFTSGDGYSTGFVYEAPCTRGSDPDSVADPSGCMARTSCETVTDNAVHSPP